MGRCVLLTLFLASDIIHVPPSALAPIDLSAGPGSPRQSAHFEVDRTATLLHFTTLAHCFIPCTCISSLASMKRC
jgi:hypothetical protein